MDRFTASVLRAYYGGMLTERQNEFLKLHYDEDLSFGEIAERFSVTRQAVADAIKTGEASLNNLESKLGVFRRDSSLSALLNGAKDCLSVGDAAKAAEKISSALSILEE